MHTRKKKIKIKKRDPLLGSLKQVNSLRKERETERETYARSQTGKKGVYHQKDRVTPIRDDQDLLLFFGCDTGEAALFVYIRLVTNHHVRLFLSINEIKTTRYFPTANVDRAEVLQSWPLSKNFFFFFRSRVIPSAALRQRGGKQRDNRRKERKFSSSLSLFFPLSAHAIQTKRRKTGPQKSSPVVFIEIRFTDLEQERVWRRVTVNYLIETRHDTERIRHWHTRARTHNQTTDANR